MPDSRPTCGAGRADARRGAAPGLVLAAAAIALTAPPSASLAGTSPVDTWTPGAALSQGHTRAVASKRLPRHGWALSLDLRVAPRTSMALGLGPAARLGIRRGFAGRTLVELPGGRRERLRGERRGRWTVLHLQARRGPRGSMEIALGGATSSIKTPGSGRLTVRLDRGEAVLGPPLVTSLRDTARLLLHRLAALDARVPQRRFLRGADARDRLHFSSRSWTRGFLSGALWQAGALLPGRDDFERAALRRTRATFGYERADSHDVGFVYENSSVAAYRRLCRPGARATETCDALRASGLEAADRLLELADTNRVAGTIPTRESRPSPMVADTIIDSLMNLPLLYWATDVTGDPSYRELAARHAHRVSQLLVRPDGSTTQSVHFHRPTGRVLLVHTHQGFSAASTWARGQAWAVYGFTVSAAALRSRELLGAAERTAGWVADHLPASGTPPYDYGAPPGSPEDTSAGVITAAGALRLARLCERWSGTCEQPARWRPLGRRLLRAALRHVSRSVPLGYLGRQVGTFGGHASWDDDAELVYGLRYALEAVRLAR
jgi:unsaturated chondroitin disaccharide hydrolase